MRKEPEIVRRLRMEEKNGILYSSQGVSNADIDKTDMQYQNISININNYNKLTKEIHTADEYFRVLVEDISDWIWEVDRNGRYTYVSPKVKELLGYEPDEVVGKTFFDFMQKDESSRILITFNRCVELNNPIIRLEHIDIHKNGSKVVLETSGIPVLDESKNLIGFRGVSRDVSSRKKMEDLLRIKNEELKKINKELEDYAYIISHDLKAPLRSLHVFSGLLLEDENSQISNQGKDYLMRIKNSSKRMSNLIEDLLKIARIGREKIEVEVVDFNELLLEVGEDLKGVLKQKNAEMIISDMPYLKCNKTLIAELFRNLISNGIKFNSGSNPKVEIGYIEKMDFYKFYVKDNGIGIEEEYFGRIFNIFKRLHSDDEYEGTGAGLTICKKIVEEHKGKIWVESLGIGKGTTFYFTIPKKL